VTYIKTYSSSI